MDRRYWERIFFKGQTEIDKRVAYDWAVHKFIGLLQNRENRIMVPHITVISCGYLMLILHN